jgi:hypothetical protein
VRRAGGLGRTCKTIHEEVQPIRETTLTVARAGGELTLSWIGVRGMYYKRVIHRGTRREGAVKCCGRDQRARLVSGEPIVVKIACRRVRSRAITLLQDSKPLCPENRARGRLSLRRGRKSSSSGSGRVFVAGDRRMGVARVRSGGPTSAACRSA